MDFKSEISKLKTIFIDTAPIIYYIEGHNQFGKFSKEVVDAFQKGELIAYSSVITITEVLPKPFSLGKNELADEFLNFLRNGRNIHIIEISDTIAELAGKLRGKYKSLKSLDAIQLATAINLKADAFLTNDIRLKQVKEIRVIVLADYI